MVANDAAASNKALTAIKVVGNPRYFAIEERTILSATSTSRLSQSETLGMKVIQGCLLAVQRRNCRQQSAAKRAGAVPSPACRRD